MSNPAVLKLVSLTETLEDFPYRFDIEDNIGEAIHIHYKDFRIDLTIKQFYDLAESVEKIIEKLIVVDGFSCGKFDKVNLVGLSGLLPYLKEIREEKIKLDDLEVFSEDDDGKPCIKKLENSRVVLALNGNSFENDMREQINYYSNKSSFVQTNSQRLDYNLDYIKKYGYPSNDERIILFNNSNVIRDGGHRAGILYYLYGKDYEVDIRRLFFDEEKVNISENKDEVLLDLANMIDINLKANEIEIDIHNLIKKNNNITAIMEKF